VKDLKTSESDEDECMSLDLADLQRTPQDQCVRAIVRTLACVRVCMCVRACAFQSLSLALRVEFLLKTESGYPRDAEVTLFTLANPEHSLRFNTHWSAPPVSALARSGGPRKVSQSPVSRNSNIETRMDRPRAVVGVIRGVA